MVTSTSITQNLITVYTLPERVLVVMGGVLLIPSSKNICGSLLVIRDVGLKCALLLLACPLACPLACQLKAANVSTRDTSIPSYRVGEG